MLVEAKWVIAVLIVCCAPLRLALAHHSFTAEFDINKPVHIEGTLSKAEWMNPHAHFYVDVKDENGNTVTWACEGRSPNVLSRHGLTKADFQPGEKIAVDGYAAKDGSHFMNVQRMYLNGRLVLEAGPETSEGR